MSTNIKPKIDHWSAYTLVIAFIVLGVIIGMSQINVIDFDLTSWLIGPFFFFAGAFLAIEAFKEPNGWSFPKEGVDIVSFMIAIVAVILGTLTFSQLYAGLAVPEAWRGLICVLAFIVSADIGVELFTG